MFCLYRLLFFCFVAGNFVATVPIQTLFQNLGKSFNPEENRNVKGVPLFEGDIVYEKPRTRNAVKDRNAIWNSRIVPYTVHESFSNDRNIQEQIELAVNEFHRLTCVRFKVRENEPDWIAIKPLSGCFSPVGRQGGAQDLSLTSGCYAKGTIMHELMHALGFWHEQSRSDRDRFIEVKWDNIENGHKQNFEKFEPEQIDTLGTSYDYGSLLHYKMNTFAKDPSQPTLWPKVNVTEALKIMGQRNGPSATDVYKINKLYNCDVTACPALVDPVSGKAIGTNFTVGSVVKYSCNKGYTLVGSYERQCLDNGVWSGEEPECIYGPTFYCNFEDGNLCGWTQDHTDSFDFSFQQGGTPTTGTGPNWDHTLQTPKGHYLYMEGSLPGYRGSTVRLVSKPFPKLSRGLCFRFSYSMYGDGIGELRVYINESPDSSVRVKTIVGNQGPGWKTDLIILKATTNFQIVIEAVRGRNYRSDIGIDDIVVAECDILSALANGPISTTTMPSTVGTRVPETHTCDFNDGSLCGWVQDKTDTFDWTQKSGSTITIGTGPDCDRTDCDKGKYMYIETSSPRLQGDVARISSPLLMGGGEKCLTFYYNMYGEDIESLEVILNEVGRSQTIWNRYRNQGRGWKKAQVVFTPMPGLFKLVVEGMRGSGYKGDIAFDDVSITQGRNCLNMAAQAQDVLNCNFDTNACAWSQNKDDTEDWVRKPKQSLKKDKGRGYVMHLSNTLLTQTKRTARLTSPLIKPTTTSKNFCLSLQYQTFSQDIGSLKVKIATYTSPVTTLWKVPVSKSGKWMQAKIPIASAEPFKVIIEGTVGSSSSEFVAVDDINLTSNACVISTQPVG